MEILQNRYARLTSKPYSCYSPKLNAVVLLYARFLPPAVVTGRNQHCPFVPGSMAVNVANIAAVIVVFGDKTRGDYGADVRPGATLPAVTHHDHLAGMGYARTGHRAATGIAGMLETQTALIVVIRG